MLIIQGHFIAASKIHPQLREINFRFVIQNITVAQYAVNLFFFNRFKVHSPRPDQYVVKEQCNTYNVLT